MLRKTQGRATLIFCVLNANASCVAIQPDHEAILRHEREESCFPCLKQIIYSWLFCKQSLKNSTLFLLPFNLKGEEKTKTTSEFNHFHSLILKNRSIGQPSFLEVIVYHRWLQLSGKKVGDFRCGIHSQNGFGCACAL